MVKINSEDSFAKFIVDENEELDKKLVAEIIEPYVESIGKNKVVEYKERFNNSPAWIKIAIYLCVRKVMLEHKIIEIEEVGPREIEQAVYVSEDSAKNISRNKNLKKIVSKKDRKYFIPNYKVRKLKEMLNGNEKSK